MIIDSIQNGIVIDHITAGKAMELYRILGLDKLDCTVAILKNVDSQKMGRKQCLGLLDRLRIIKQRFAVNDPDFLFLRGCSGRIYENKEVHFSTPLDFWILHFLFVTLLSSEGKGGRFSPSHFGSVTTVFFFL